MKFVRVLPEEIPELSAFATEIVKKHFDPIIGAAQNDYMIAHFQTVEAITGQFEHGYRYYWMQEEDGRAGFFAIFPRDGMMYLSKFYVHENFRGRHIASKAFEKIVALTAEEGLSKVFLNVNRDNTDVINIYYHLGFVKAREEKNDIGGGFYMDDYVLEYTL